MADALIGDLVVRYVSDDCPSSLTARQRGHSGFMRCALPFMLSVFTGFTAGCSTSAKRSVTMRMGVVGLTGVNVLKLVVWLGAIMSGVTMSQLKGKIPVFRKAVLINSG